MNCAHTSTEFRRRLFRGGEHLIERCVACGVNVRGPGRWVPRAELIGRGIVIADLKLDQEATPQGSLW